MKKTVIITILFTCRLFAYTLEFDSLNTFNGVASNEFIHFVDWDNDGLTDILQTFHNQSTFYDELLFLKNIGTADSPKYASGVKMVNEKGEIIKENHG